MQFDCSSIAVRLRFERGVAIPEDSLTLLSNLQGRGGGGGGVIFEGVISTQFDFGFEFDLCGDLNAQ